MSDFNRTNRRDFIKTFSLLAGSSMLVSGMPWLKTAMAQEGLRPIKVGIIGVGSRGSLLLIHLKNIPDIDISCFCDSYEPHFQRTRETLPNANGYYDYLEMLEKEDLDAVVIATPLHEHPKMTIDALDAGIHVFCEKSMARTIEECNAMVEAQQRNNKILMLGHQRMFSLKYQQAYRMISEGKLGKITQIRAYWHRNNDWRRNVPSPELERFINWRLYHDYSLGLMTELASHQIQVANQILKEVPIEVWGAGSINHWKDGREVFDNVNLVYKYPGDTHLVYDSMISNKHYGLEEQIMGPLGTMELEAGKMWDEFPPPAPGILQLINHLEHKFFDTIPIGGASWVPDEATSRKGTYIIDEVLEDDGTRMLIEAFISYARDNIIDLELTRQGLYASVAAVMGFEAIHQNRVVGWPQELAL